MELRTYPVSLVYKNPWQKRKPAFVGPEWDAFVEDVRINGVRQPPPARLHPTVEGAVQLQDGERRFTAHCLTHPDEPFAVVVETISDREMFEHGVRLNVQRRAFNDIELADIAADYIAEFGATQTEAATLIGYKTGAGVSNLIKLRKLPPEIQQHVIAGNLSDAHARALVGVANINVKAALAIAKEVAAAPKSEKAEVFEEHAEQLYWSKMVALGEDGWDMNWLADAPVTVERDLGDGDHLLPACAGCVFNVNGNCARKPCFEEKTKLWTGLEVTRIAEVLKIPAVQSDEKTAALFKGEYNDDDNAKLLLNARKDIRGLLRIAPYVAHNHNYLQRVLGSEMVTLVTTDRAAVDAYFAETRNKSSHSSNGKLAKAAKPAEESDAQREKRVAAEKAEQTANRAARSKMWKSYHDGVWLLEHAARLVGVELAKQHHGPFVTTIENVFCGRFSAKHGAKVVAERLSAEIRAANDFPLLRNQLRLTRVAFYVFAHSAVRDYFKPAENQRETDYPRAHRVITETCNRQTADMFEPAFGVTLPKGWDIPPVHHTPINCWQCGTFAGNVSEKLTQRDINEDGWIDDGKAGVFCSVEHKEMYLAAQGKSDATKPTKGKAVKKSPAKKKTKTPKRRK